MRPTRRRRSRDCAKKWRARPFTGCWRRKWCMRIPPLALSSSACPYQPHLSRAPDEASYHGGVIATLIDLAGHAAVAVSIGRMAPTIDLRIDYLRPADNSESDSDRDIDQGGPLGRVVLKSPTRKAA